MKKKLLNMLMKSEKAEKVDQIFTKGEIEMLSKCFESDAFTKLTIVLKSNLLNKNDSIVRNNSDNLSPSEKKEEAWNNTIELSVLKDLIPTLNNIIKRYTDKNED